MTENKKTILVAWDFSEYAQHALSHALFYSSQTKFDVYLLHIVRDKAIIDSTKASLDKVAGEIFETHAQRVETVVKVGNLSDGLKITAQELNSVMIFGGLPGFSGLQRFIGHYVMNAILGSIIPSIVVQKPKLKTDDLTLICPIDHRKQSKANLAWVQKFAKNCKVKIHLVYPDCPYPIKGLKIKSNVNFAKNYLNRVGIKFEEKKLVHIDFRLNMVDFAADIKADLILNITQKESKLKSLFFKSNDHKLVANEKQIPVMSIRPYEGAWKYIGFR